MKNLRKILAILLCCAMMMGALPMSVAEGLLEAAPAAFIETEPFAVSVEDPTEELPELTEVVILEEIDPAGLAVEEDNGLLDIKAADYEVEDGRLLYYNGTASTFTVPAGVTVIGGYAFEGNTRLTSVVLPSGLTTIEESAFANCSALNNVNIPATVTVIGADAFSGTALTAVTLPSGVTKIAESTFAGCEALASVSIPATVTVIERMAFAGCRALTAVTLPSGLTKLGASAFAGCSVLATVNLPAGLTEISESTFMSCYALNNVTLPSAIARIGARAFYECGALTELVIPSAVAAIGAEAFHNCHALTLRVDAGSAAYTYCVNNAAAQGFSYQLTSIPAEFTVNNGVLVAYTGSAANVIIPDAVTSIGNGAFQNNTSLQTVQIPGSVTAIGSNAFSGCTGLANLQIPGSVTTIGSNAFNNCNSLTTVTIPASVTSIGAGAFAGCDDLTAINVAEGSTAYSSADGVLYNANMTQLLCYPAGKPGTTFTVPACVTSVANGAFAGCTGLTVTVFEGSAAHQYMIANAAADGVQYVVVPAPAAPVTLPRPTMGNHTVISSLKLKLTWNAVEGAEGYELWRSDAANGTYTKVADTTALEKIDDCIFGKINYYKVRAYATVNGQKIYSQFSVYRSSFGLATPGIQKVEMTANGVKITAKTVANATGYYIYRCETPNGLYDRLGTTTLSGGENFFMDTTAVNGKTYYYKARAYHTSYTNVAEGVTYVGPFSVAKNITVSYTAPARVTMGPHTVISSLKLKLTWNAVPGADGYELWRSDAANGTYTKVADTTSLEKIDDCIFGKINYYKVRAYDSVNGQKIYGQFSVYRSSFGLATAGIKTLTSTTNGIKITHSSVANATGYYIYRCDTQNGLYERLGTSSVVGGVNTYIDTTAVPGKTYYYKCRVYHTSYTNVAEGVTYVGPFSVGKSAVR